MALIKCSECGKEVSSNADACPNCGNPIKKGSASNQINGTFCPSCKINVTPIATSVGGGSCSFGKRETWKCPQCKRVLHRSGCYVATITYGDEDQVEVQFLRAFRDEIMRHSSIGRLSIWIYYHVAPYAAHIVELVPPLKPYCRKLLDKIINLIEYKTRIKRNNIRIKNSNK